MNEIPWGADHPEYDLTAEGNFLAETQPQTLLDGVP